MKHATIRKAAPADVPAITATVCKAYVNYIERIGKHPGPMLEDFEDTVSAAQVHVAELQARVVGIVVLIVTEEGFYLDNIAVRPSEKGTGVGRRLLELAESEAKRQGYNLIYLATHELMHENRALYSRIGYVEYDHRVVNAIHASSSASSWPRPDPLFEPTRIAMAQSAQLER